MGLRIIADFKESLETLENVPKSFGEVAQNALFKLK